MAELIFNSLVEGFAYSKTTADGEDLYKAEISTGAPAITAGETYTVILDGLQYVCAAQEDTIGGESGVVVGNPTITDSGGTNTGEPFLYMYNATAGAGSITTLFTETKHTVELYAGLVENESNVIIAERVYTFSNGSDSDIYSTSVNNIAMEAGELYTVFWDGTRRVCTAKTATVYGTDAVVIGDQSIDAGLFPDGENTDEEFLLGYVAAYSMTVFETLETDRMHTVAVYKGEVEEDSGGTEDGYLLKDAELAFELETNSETIYYNNEVAVAISVGKTYTVIWDGSYYDCVAKEYTKDSLTAIVLGNLNIQDNTAENTGEPFLYLYVNVGGNAAANFKTLEKDASHVISIYDGVLEHPAVTHADIYTYDKDGNAVLHEKRSTVTFDTPDGRYAVFKLSHIADSRS